ncbi:hypothetical protein JCM10450v2_005791 [Rhodotorula kratochvilovae]
MLLSHVSLKLRALPRPATPAFTRRSSSSIGLFPPTAEQRRASVPVPSIHERLESSPEITVADYAQRFFIPVAHQTTAAPRSSSSSPRTNPYRAALGPRENPNLPHEPVAVISYPWLSRLLSSAGDDWLNKQEHARTAIKDLPRHLFTDLALAASVNNNLTQIPPDGHASKQDAAAVLTRAGDAAAAFVRVATAEASHIAMVSPSKLGKTHRVLSHKEIQADGVVCGMFELEGGAVAKGVISQLAEDFRVDALLRPIVVKLLWELKGDQYKGSQNLILKALLALQDVETPEVAFAFFHDWTSMLPVLKLRLDGPVNVPIPSIARRLSLPTKPMPCEKPYIVLVGDLAPLASVVDSLEGISWLHQVLATMEEPSILRARIFRDMRAHEDPRVLLEETGSTSARFPLPDAADASSKPYQLVRTAPPLLPFTGLSSLDLVPLAVRLKNGQYQLLPPLRRLSLCPPINDNQLADSLAAVAHPPAHSALGVAPHAPLRVLLADEEPLAGGRSADICRVVAADGPALVLKVGFADRAEDVEREAAVYACWSEELEGIAPRCVGGFAGVWDGRETAALLLEDGGAPVGKFDDWDDVPLAERRAAYALLCRMHERGLQHGDWTPFNAVKKGDDGDGIRIIDLVTATGHACEGPGRCGELCGARAAMGL